MKPVKERYKYVATWWDYILRAPQIFQWFASELNVIAYRAEQTERRQEILLARVKTLETELIRLRRERKTQPEPFSDDDDEQTVHRESVIDETTPLIGRKK